MIKKIKAHCSIRQTAVEALVEDSKARVGKETVLRRIPLSCGRVAECPKTTFCRFVNPLTTRNPLSLEEAEAESAAG
ncbi:MAG: hypothetical protein N3A66_03860 [Planctomycetota bacterium]|nr:hypothetical protein [Planctomycetota bacterium]